METTPALDKSALRELCLDRRDALSPLFRETASIFICDFVFDFLSNLTPFQDVEISLYLPIRSEVDLSGLIPRLEECGACISLPVVLNRTDIAFRRFRSGDVLQNAGFGTIGPAPDADIVDPAILLMPLAGFDQYGARIGYGAGHYDRAVARLLQKGQTPITYGVGFAVQAVPQIPAEQHDVPLEVIFTEEGVIVPVELNL